MEINLETDEKVKLMIDDACEFLVWGERNEEGTMIIKSKYYEEQEKDTDVAQSEPKGCGKRISGTNQDGTYVEMDCGDFNNLCEVCKKNG